MCVCLEVSVVLQGLKFYGQFLRNAFFTLHKWGAGVLSAEFPSMPWADLQTHCDLFSSSSTEAHQEQTFKDDSDAATLRQTLPDLTPDEASEAAALPAEDPAPELTDSAPQQEGEEPVAGDDAAGDHGSDESPNKSPSKKKKKFRTPSFLKKNKKKSETQWGSLAIPFFKPICFCTVSVHKLVRRSFYYIFILLAVLAERWRALYGKVRLVKHDHQSSSLFLYRKKMKMNNHYIMYRNVSNVTEKK